MSLKFDTKVALVAGGVLQDVAEMVAFFASGRVRHATDCTINITGADYVR